jgi:hypothetical protein
MVSAEANLLFSMLEALDRVVVLLDEVDELVRERTGSGEFLSRFLTTTMLPKLAAISGGKRIVFVVATNHIEQFDVAISRPGRFDLLLQVMPPTADEKFGRWPSLAEKLAVLVRDDDVKRQHLNALTFDEAGRLATRVATATRPDAGAELERIWTTCTLNTPIDRTGDSRQTWLAVCEHQQTYNRVPGDWTPVGGSGKLPRAKRSATRARTRAKPQ